MRCKRKRDARQRRKRWLRRSFESAQREALLEISGGCRSAVLGCASLLLDIKRGYRRLDQWGGAFSGLLWFFYHVDHRAIDCFACDQQMQGRPFSARAWLREHEKKHVAQLGEEQVKIFEAAVALGKIEKAVDLLALFDQVFPPEAIERIG